MTDKNNRHAAANHRTHFINTFALKKSVADTQSLVDDQNIGLDKGIDGESQPCEHARRISFDGLIYKVADVREGDNVINFCVHNFAAVPHQKSVHVNIFYARHFGIETRAEFQKRGNSSVDFQFAAARSQNARDNF